MSLSTCLVCGGHIPLGPEATNRCEDCGAGVFSNTGLNREDLLKQLVEAKKLLDWAANALQPHELRIYTGGSGDGWPNAEMVVRYKILNFLKANS
jgi:hypothetical protein